MPPMSDDLGKSISEYIKAWHTMSVVYATISILLRGSLIIASGLVAAKLGANKFLSETALAILSIYVAAGTAIEAWLKPREKWKGFMTDCENAEDLFLRLQNDDGTDPKRIDDFRTEFQRILATHREKNVF
jgi:hypothetical protein